MQSPAPGGCTWPCFARNSAPEVLVNEVIDAFRARYQVTVELVETAVEDIEFKVPRILREPV